MCGRFALSAKTKDIENLVPDLKIKEEIKPRYNIAPSQNIAAVLNDGKKELTFLKWGLIPSWAKDSSIGNKMINARAETLQEKPSFKNSLKNRRCLIFADGFFEWKQIPGEKRKVPYFIKLKSGGPFTFAGLWDKWKDDAGNLIHSTTIITTEPNELMSAIHNRMPVILPADLREEWLSNNLSNTEILQSYLKPYDKEEMEAYEISGLVNNPAYDSEECIIPLEKV